jgi:hypothetical protein
MTLQLRFFKGEFAVCQLRDLSKLDLSQNLCFLAKTPDELSLVCAADSVPENAIKTEGGWSLFRIEGQLDFGLIGILAKLTTLLAENNISVFAVSTFNTDYILVKTISLAAARELFKDNGYGIL